MNSQDEAELHLNVSQEAVAELFKDSLRMIKRPYESASDVRRGRSSSSIKFKPLQQNRDVDKSKNVLDDPSKRMATMERIGHVRLFFQR